jgi:hypothetical protein
VPVLPENHAGGGEDIFLKKTEKYFSEKICYVPILPENHAGGGVKQGCQVHHIVKEPVV